jgi:hypothetical protein
MLQYLATGTTPSQKKKVLRSFRVPLCPRFTAGLVSSRNRSSACARSGFSRSCGKLRGRPLSVRCLRRAAVKWWHWKSTCRGSPHGQAICSGVCCGKKRARYARDLWVKGSDKQIQTVCSHDEFLNLYCISLAFPHLLLQELEAT